MLPRLINKDNLELWKLFSVWLKKKSDMESVYFLSINAIYLKCRESLILWTEAAHLAHRWFSFCQSLGLGIFPLSYQTYAAYLALLSLQNPCRPCEKTVHLVIVHIAVFEAWETQLDLLSLQSMCSFQASKIYLLIDLLLYSGRPTVPSAAKKTSKCKNSFIWKFIPLRKHGTVGIFKSTWCIASVFAYMTFWPANQHSISCFEINKIISIPKSSWHCILILFMFLY